MKKRVISLISALIIFAFAASAEGANSLRASDYLVGYGVALEAMGDSEMRIYYDVDGKGRMEKIGAEALYIEYYDGDAWRPFDTLLGAQNADFYSYDALGHLNYAYFDGEPGVKYRVTLKAYAKGYDGGSDTGYVTSYEEICK